MHRGDIEPSQQAYNILTKGQRNVKFLWQYKLTVFWYWELETS